MSSQDYAKMIEIDVSDSQIITKPKKPRLSSFIKRLSLTQKILATFKKPKLTIVEEKSFVSDDNSQPVEEVTEPIKAEKTTKRKFKFDFVAVQVATIFLLIVGIMLTNIFWEDSGINTIIKSVFNVTESVNNKEYTSFTAFAPTKGSVTITDGIMTVSNGSIYSPCEGKVLSLLKSDDKYTLTIGHSDSYKTVISNVDFVYFDVGDKVSVTTPCSYAYQNAQVSMYNGDNILTNYTLSNGSIVWQN